MPSPGDDQWSLVHSLSSQMLLAMRCAFLVCRYIFCYSFRSFIIEIRCSPVLSLVESNRCALTDGAGSRSVLPTSFLQVLNALAEQSNNDPFIICCHFTSGHRVHLR